MVSTPPLWAQKTLEIKGFFWVWSADFWIWSRRLRAQGVGVDPCLLIYQSGALRALSCFYLGKAAKHRVHEFFSSVHATQSGKSKWGLSKWGLKVLVHNCPQLPTIVVILWRKFPSERGPKRPQKCTIVHDCAQIAESGLKPPFESPHLDFPDTNVHQIWAFGIGPDPMSPETREPPKTLQKQGESDPFPSEQTSFVKISF